MVYGSLFTSSKRYIRFFLFVESSSPSTESSSDEEHKPVIKGEAPVVRRQTMAELALRLIQSKTDLFLGSRNQD